MASLRIKILLILVLFLCAVGSVSFGVGAYLFHHSLVDFEQRATAAQLARVESGFLQDVDALARIAADNAVWDDAVDYMQRPTPGFLEKTFTLESLKNIEVHALAFFYPDGRLHSSVDARGGQRGTLHGDDAVVLVAIAAVGAALVFDRLIFKRLALFATKARSLHGAPTGVVHEWPVQGNDELDVLALALNDMVLDLEQSRDQLMRDSRTDSLTGLGNRRLLLEKLEHFLGLRQRQGSHATLSIAVLLLDIDDFKIINDSLGHEAGNFLLKEIAHSLQTMVRASDVVARLGGDEFALIFAANNDEIGVDQFASRVQKTISMPRNFNGSVLTVSASIGIAIATVTSDHDSLLRNADLAMYASKAAGKARHSFFQDVMLANVQERMVLEQQLRECLRLDELEVWFQPIVDMRTHEVAMFEALARWPLAGGGYCPPDRFIPVAEESGLIHQLGADVARKVVEAMPALRALNPHHVVNINLAPKQLMSKLLVQQMCALFDNAGLPRACIHFELTESALASDANYATAQLNALAQAGFHLHLDDFGTGYSSLHRLRSMPFSTLKLDRSFVILMSNGDDRIARVIIALAQQLNMDVIAEGVETAPQQAQLLALGCHLVQGYYYAKPMPLAQLLAWLQGPRVPAQA